MADNQSPDIFGQTPWQTVGPFFHYSLPWRGGADLVGQSEWGARPDLFPADHDILNRAPARGAVEGEIIEIVGRVRDGAGEPVPDALLEIWQADSAGRYGSDDGFLGFGRCATDADGGFRFRTVRPGPTPGPGNVLQAPHIALGILGRGLLKRLVTRIYFADVAENAEDPILALTPEARRDTLIAVRQGGAPAVWRFDIVLQGDGETVFFEF